MTVDAKALLRAIVEKSQVRVDKGAGFDVPSLLIKLDIEDIPKTILGHLTHKYKIEL